MPCVFQDVSCFDSPDLDHIPTKQAFKQTRLLYHNYDTPTSPTASAYFGVHDGLGLCVTEKAFEATSDRFE